MTLIIGTKSDRSARRPWALRSPEDHAAQSLAGIDHGVAPDARYAEVQPELRETLTVGRPNAAS